jgi:hypothetical protein
MANKTQFPYYLLLALAACALLLFPYLVPQSAIESKREDSNNSVPSVIKKIRPTIEAKPVEISPREPGANRKEENKRKLDEIEKLLE